MSRRYRPLEDHEKVAVERDYSRGGNITRFNEEYPSRLKQWKVSEEEFKRTILEVNRYFIEAEQVGVVTFFEGCFGCLSLFSLFLCYDTHYNKVLRKLEHFIEEENDRVYRAKGLELLNPLYNGLLELEFKIVTHPEEDEDGQRSSANQQRRKQQTLEEVEEQENH